MPDFPFPLMIFAAGFGTRMGALTADRPKPLIPVAGRPLIDHALQIAAGAGAHRIVANTHYRAEQLAAHLTPKGVAISHEAGPILETGGGLRAALPLLGPGPVAVLNSDGIWTGANPLAQLAAAWDPKRMETLLLLLPLHQALARGGKGDFRLDDQGRISRGQGGEDHVYIGACILAPDRLAAIEEEAFSLNRPWNDMIAAGTAFGLVHQGRWCDVGHPAGIAEAEQLLAQAAHG
ncbi:nucleotidyltransferase family protein [Tabrizicola aquatica]|uniref:nucleotidyltransferase family protein n=1 Tax=Tabrizicola aquatica TaxID=909926 RepID=UPI000CCFD5C3|nr:nucleotidyltransferase family protein [Tabrizicola aquatica]